MLAKAGVPGSVKEDKDYDAELYKQRHKIECMFGALRDFRRVAMRYDRSPVMFQATIFLACLFTFWL